MVVGRLLIFQTWHKNLQNSRWRKTAKTTTPTRITSKTGYRLKWVVFTTWIINTTKEFYKTYWCAIWLLNYISFGCCSCCRHGKMSPKRPQQNTSYQTIFSIFFFIPIFRAFFVIVHSPNSKSFQKYVCQNNLKKIYIFVHNKT